MTYIEKLRDPRWQRKRVEVLQRDDFKCRDCGCGDRTLEVHHCHYDKREPWEMESDLLLTLCGECHELRGEIEAGAKRSLAVIMSRMANGGGAMELINFANTLARFAANPNSDARMGAGDYLSEGRWIEYATQYKAMRALVEMVLGRKISWGTTT